MKNLAITISILFSLNVFSEDYKSSSCYQKYKQDAKEHVEKIKEKKENPGFGAKVSSFFCSVDKATQLLMQQPGSALVEQKNCDDSIDYRKQNNSQIILNLSYSNANSLKATDEKECLSQSPCHGSLYTLGGTDIVGSMEIASDILKEAREINSSLKNWSHIQPIIQNAMSENVFCQKKKNWSLRKVKKYILKQIKKETVQTQIKVNDSQRENKSVESDSSPEKGQEPAESTVE